MLQKWNVAVPEPAFSQWSCSFIKKQSQQTKANTLANYVKICLKCADAHFGTPGSDVTWASWPLSAVVTSDPAEHLLCEFGCRCDTLGMSALVSIASSPHSFCQSRRQLPSLHTLACTREELGVAFFGHSWKENSCINVSSESTGLSQTHKSCSCSTVQMAWHSSGQAWILPFCC